MALAAAFVHCNEGFRLLETSTPKSLSCCTFCNLAQEWIKMSLCLDFTQ